MNFIAAVIAAFVAITPALAAPLDSRQISNFDQTVTIALSSRYDGDFIQRTNYGVSDSSEPAVDTSNPNERYRYAFDNLSDVKQFSWNANGRKLQVSLYERSSADSTVF